MSARIEYAPGEAWCVAAGRVVLVCERDLTPERATGLHAEIASIDTVDGLRELLESEPTALTGLLDLDGRRVLLRRHGVPATAGDAPLIDRYGSEWATDETSAEQAVEAGGLGSLTADTLPLEGGVVRVAAVRVQPGSTDASADVPEADAVDDVKAANVQSFGAFGQTMPPAAVAEARAAEAVEVEPAVESEPAPVVEPEPALEPRPEPEPAPAAASALDLETTTADPAEFLPAAPVQPPAASDTGSSISGLIDSVPGFIKPAVDLHAAVGTPVPAVRPEPAVPSAAVASTPTAQSPRAEAPMPIAPAQASAPAVGDFGDHDGMTVTADQARKLMDERQQREAALSPATGPLVLSTLCPEGHVNAPGSLQCHLCGAQIDEGSAAQRRRPEVAVVVLPSGERIPLGRGVVIGRRPRSRRVEDGRVPRLVTVDSPGEDISRSHVELRVEDWNLVAIDLSSTNGTLLLRVGASPQRLRPEASTILQLGDRLDLGDGVVVTIESAP